MYVYIHTYIFGMSDIDLTDILILTWLAASHQ